MLKLFIILKLEDRTWIYWCERDDDHVMLDGFLKLNFKPIVDKSKFIEIDGSDKDEHLKKIERQLKINSLVNDNI